MGWDGSVLGNTIPAHHGVDIDGVAIVFEFKNAEASTNRFTVQKARSA